jgi:NitT/TauT family transport system ATP-binding protein
MEKDKTLKARGHIELNQISIHYHLGRETVRAVEKFTLEAKPGEFICILGPSGCGKSSVLYAVAGFIKTVQGFVCVDQQMVNKPGADRGVIFQQYNLFPWLKVHENISFGLRMQGISRRNRYERALKYIEMVGLGGFENKFPSQLSGGMQQRVAIARALANQPSVLLMDEPFGALDAQTRLMMQELVLDIWESSHTTILFVTHDVEEAIFLADRIFLMTAHPGTLKAKIPIIIPRPRAPDSIILNHDYIKTKQFLLSAIREESTK